MIKTIWVDDERLALERLNNMVMSLEHCQVVGMYLNAVDAIHAVACAGSDVEFLDVRMPEMNVLEVAAFLRRISPATEIVFVIGEPKHVVIGMGNF